MPTDFKCSTVYRANRILYNIFKRPSFRPKVNFFKILNAAMVKNPKRVMTM